MDDIILSEEKAKALDESKVVLEKAKASLIEATAAHDYLLLAVCEEIAVENSPNADLYDRARDRLMQQNQVSLPRIQNADGTCLPDKKIRLLGFDPNAPAAENKPVLPVEMIIRSGYTYITTDPDSDDNIYTIKADDYEGITSFILAYTNHVYGMSYTDEKRGEEASTSSSQSKKPSSLKQKTLALLGYNGEDELQEQVDKLTRENEELRARLAEAAVIIRSLESSLEQAKKDKVYEEFEREMEGKFEE